MEQPVEYFKDQPEHLTEIVLAPLTGPMDEISGPEIGAVL